MQADPQDGRGMGVDGLVQWRGNSIHSTEHLWDSTMIDLLEWPLPQGFGRAYGSPAHLGINSLSLQVPDLAACFQACNRSSWLEILTEPSQDAVLAPAGFSGQNPDGTVLEFVQGEAASALNAIHINVRDLQRSIGWYCTVLGFELAGELAEVRLPASDFTAGRPAHLIKARLQLPGRSHDCCLQLQQWLQPQAHGQPYQQANHNGLFRVAFAVADAAECYRQLPALGANCPHPPAWLDMGPDIPVDGVWALFFFDPDGTCVELIQNPDFTV